MRGDSSEEFQLSYPDPYDSRTPGLFSLSSRSQSLSDWCRAANATLSQSSSTTKTVGEALDIVMKTPRSKRSKSDDQEGATTTSTATCFMSDDMDVEGKQFEDGLSQLMMKKKWAAKEAEIRREAASSSKKGGANNELARNESEKSKVTQIFSSGAATGVLTNDLLAIMEDASSESPSLGFTAEPVEDNIYDWRVKMSKFREDSPMGRDLMQLEKSYGFGFVELRVSFVLDLYPFFPPLVRIVRPRFTGFMMGRVTSMPTLRLSGWDPFKDMRQVLTLIKDLLEEHGRPDVDNPMNDASVYPDGAYTPLEFSLLRLELLTETPSRVSSKYPELSKSPTAPAPALGGPVVPAAAAAAAAALPLPPTKARKEEGGAKKSTYWAKGTGYGFDAGGKGKGWDINAYKAAQRQKDLETASVLRSIAQELHRANGAGAQQSLQQDVVAVDESCLIPVLENYLRNDSLLDVSEHHELYTSVLDIASALVSGEQWLPLFERQGESSSGTMLVDLIHALNRQARAFLKAAAAPDSGADKAAREEAERSMSLVTSIVSISDTMDKNLERVAASIAELEKSAGKKSTRQSAAPLQETPEQIYAKALRPLQFDAMVMDLRTHHYASHVGSVSSATSKRTNTVRIAQEEASLAVSLPLSCDSSVFLRIDEERVDFLKVLITGPMAADYGETSTPYAGGCFLFDVHFPTTYPNDPPLVNLMTTGHGSVRFNPNLYNCGKVCLSLLGTWRGAEGENWNAKTSTLLQVLVSIQSLIMVPKPFFNEPGYERQIGTTQGERSSEQYNDNIRAATLQYAVLEQLKSPTPGFEDVIRRHFYLLQDRITEQMNRWTAEAQPRSRSQYSTLLRISRQIQDEFAKLSYPFPRLPA